MDNLLFRIESKTDKYNDVFNTGFYGINTKQGNRLYSELGFSDCDRNHPTPWEDSKIKGYWNNLSCEEQEQHFFGFSSLPQWKRWFYQDWWLDEIKKYVCLSVYEVRTLHNGYTQSICHIDDVVKKVATFEVDQPEDEILKTLLWDMKHEYTTN